MIWIGLALAILPWMAQQRPRRIRRLRSGPGLLPDGAGVVPISVILELMVAALQTGVSIPRALIAVGTNLPGATRIHLVKAGRQLELGAPWDQAWRHAGLDLAILRDGLRHAWEAGTSPTASLRTAGEAARRHQLEAARLAAAKLGVRLVLPLGLCLLPAFILIGLVPVMLSLGSGLLGQ